MMLNLKYFLILISVFFLSMCLAINENFQQQQTSICTQEMRLDPVAVCKNREECCEANGGNCFCESTIIKDCEQVKKNCEQKMCKYSSKQKCTEMCKKVRNNCCDYSGSVLAANRNNKYLEPVTKKSNTSLCKYSVMPENTNVCPDMCLYYPGCTGYTLKRMSTITKSPITCSLLGNDDQLFDTRLKTDTYHQKK